MIRIYVLQLKLKSVTLNVLFDNIKDGILQKGR